jgi:hypothetical protein
MAEIVGGDLYHLWRVSEVHLPRIADVYYDAGRDLHAASGDGPDRFRAGTPAGPDGTVMSSTVGAAWADLRAELMGMYREIGETVLDAAAAVRHAQQAYVEADLANADALSTYLADPAKHDPNDPLSNPPSGDADDHPGVPAPSR